MGIARSTYYDYPEHPADNTAIVEAMFEVCDEFESYGNRRLGATLRQQGLIVNHKKIRRLVRQHDLQPRMRRRFMATTDSSHGWPIYPNLARDVLLKGPKQFWVGDITYVRQHLSASMAQSSGLLDLDQECCRGSVAPCRGKALPGCLEDTIPNLSRSALNTSVNDAASVERMLKDLIAPRETMRDLDSHVRSSCYAMNSFRGTALLAARRLFASAL
jgi:hypothetical protein